MKKYFLGVDGGNTKTDYLLYTTDGEYADMHRTGTCSHEQFGNGFAGMEKAMSAQLSELFARNGISVKNIEAAGFGLAGADLPYQVAELKKRVESIGFTQYGLFNDGILGIKAASENGVGLCVVNGTGTVVIGADTCGKFLQVGGVGSLSGDTAGGTYIRDRIITFMYAHYYRCGAESSMFADVMRLIDANPQDLSAVISDYPALEKHMTDIIKIGVKAALAGDAVAKKIFDDVGISIAKSAAGCIRNLGFKGFGTEENPIDIIKVGTIWKIPYDGMNAAFIKTVSELSGKTCRIVNLKAPAAAGGVLWAKEIADGIVPDPEYRKKVLNRPWA
ncbi:MAG: hypothetical protein FWF79_04765 [Defluviitaleaceae bacterium]|nr:hypothetical protein [Defluviitaleaceae bacterium]